MYGDVFEPLSFAPEVKILRLDHVLFCSGCLDGIFVRLLSVLSISGLGIRNGDLSRRSLLDFGNRDRFQPHFGKKGGTVLFWGSSVLQFNDYFLL